jgi:hypothetical protein
MNPEVQRSVQMVLLEYLDYAMTIKDSNILGDPVKGQIMLQMSQAINYLVPLVQNEKEGELQLKSAETQMNLQSKQAELQMKAQEHQMKMQQSQNEHAMKLQQSHDNHQNSLVQGQQSHQAKLAMQKQQPSKGGQK